MTNHEDDKAIAIPTKTFFVSMLTRDISLIDAILDLVDNSLDGALRVADDDNVDYSKHQINIVCDAAQFVINDNCGGIPRDVAKNYAFKMGREIDDERDSATETIGMYGVGMKRAIFKMGRNSIVRSNHKGDAFSVPITPEWLDEKEWESLPINSDSDKEALSEYGTEVRVGDLYSGVASHFELSSFIEDLQASIGEHFTVFLQKGLTVSVNGNTVNPVLVEVLVSLEEGGPAPYTFQQEIDRVLVSIVVGLNTGRNSDDDDAGFELTRSSISSGWTVFCNDRAIIVGDKTRLTGWGDGIPLYHAQFSVITGIVEFRSTIAGNLPITTTKRALDTSSDVWLQARIKMREGLRVWINHTNAWKNHPRSEQSEYWQESVSLQIDDAVKAVLSRDNVTKRQGGLEYNPKKKGVLPDPPSKKPSSRRVVFSRPAEEIRELSDALFDFKDEKPGVVGDECFNVVLKQVREGEENE